MSNQEELSTLRTLINDRSKLIASEIGSQYNSNVIECLQCIFQYTDWELAFLKSQIQSLVHQLAHFIYVQKTISDHCDHPEHKHTNTLIDENDLMVLRTQLRNSREEEAYQRQRANALHYEYNMLKQQSTLNSQSSFSTIDQLQCDVLLKSQSIKSLESTVSELEDILAAQNKRHRQIITNLETHFRTEIDRVIRIRVEERRSGMEEGRDMSLFCEYCRVRHQPIPLLERDLQRVCSILESVFCLWRSREESREEWIGKIEKMHERERSEEGYYGRKVRNVSDQQRLRNQHTKNIINMYCMKDMSGSVVVS